jgi:hypothetical protein
VLPVVESHLRERWEEFLARRSGVATGPLLAGQVTAS